MAYRFETDEPVRSAILRTAGEQLDHAVAELTVELAEDPVTAVHAARKAIKKERSLLRLVRGSIDPDQRRRENGALRHASRSLSTARDAEAMLDTLAELAERYVGQLPEATFEQIAVRLRQRRDRERAELMCSSVAGAAAGELYAIRVRQAQWTLSADGWAAIEKGLRRGYRDGRGLFAQAQACSQGRSFQGWHAWRKRVKDLWYHERLLAAVGGPVVKGQAKDAHRLADLLGDDHDLGVLADALQSAPVAPPVDVDSVLGLIGQRRRELRTGAVLLGARVYAESPKRFVRRMRSSWEAGCALARASQERDATEPAQAVRAAP